MVSPIEKSQDNASPLPYLLIRWLFLLTILAVEIIGITIWFESPTVADDTGWSAWVFENSYELLRIGIVCVGVFLLTLIPRFKSVFRSMLEQSVGYHWWIWLIFQILAFIAFIFLTAFIFENLTNPTFHTDPIFQSTIWFWLVIWLVLGSTTLILWLLTLAPSVFWLHLARNEYTGLIFGLVSGFFIWILAALAQKELWISLAKATLRLVYIILGLVYSDLVYQTEIFVIGTSSFRVEIAHQCSGYEGIILVTVFLAIYLWLFRKELRFPQAFWLFPLGVLAIWCANVIRIAALVAIGTSFSRKVAAGGFHSQAGWIAFTLIVLGLVTLSHRMRFFAVTNLDSAVVRNSTHLAAALLVPLMVLVATSMITATFSTGFEALYPLGVVAAAAALWHYRKSYSVLSWSWSWQAAVIGVAVFLLWMALEPNVDSSETELARGLGELSAWLAGIWLAFRVFGSVIVVPLVEELAFRSYILRKLIARDFENVPVAQFTWLSFIMSSVLFGLLHGRWLAGTLAGMAYALALYRRGQIGDAVLAHTTTNALIAISVLVQGRWELWS